MKLRRHLVVMVRAPQMGRVKRRLARDMDAVRALRFYHVCSERLLRRLSRDPRWTTWLAVTPDVIRFRPRLWPKGMRRMAQGGGDLGARMDRILRVLPPGPVVIVGSDIPGIEARHVARAFRLLGSHHTVFGPAADGGYWLVGAHRFPRCPDLFRSVRWSGEHALTDTLTNLGADPDAAFVEMLSDVDRPEDYRDWKKNS
jgi:rSAM/selenodomain-associated transferase 1